MSTARKLNIGGCADRLRAPGSGLRAAGSGFGLVAPRRKKNLNVITWNSHCRRRTTARIREICNVRWWDEDLLLLLVSPLFSFTDYKTCLNYYCGKVGISLILNDRRTRPLPPPTFFFTLFKSLAQGESRTLFINLHPGGKNWIIIIVTRRFRLFLPHFKNIINHLIIIFFYTDFRRCTNKEEELLKKSYTGAVALYKMLMTSTYTDFNG